MTLIQSELISAKEILGTIESLNGQNDIGIEDLIKSVEKAKVQCLQPGLLLDFIIAQKITLSKKNTIRFININSYDDLYDALRQNLKQKNSILALKSKVESCKQGMTETVQNFITRYRQILNEINYATQAQYQNPTERRIKIKMEEQEAINRYLLNLKREIRLQIRSLKPTTLAEAQGYASETEMWIKKSQPARIQPPKQAPRAFIRATSQPRPSENTTGTAAKIPNQNIALADRTKISCHKCGKLGHFASQCMAKQGFQTAQFHKRPPQIKILQLEEQENECTECQEITQDEIREQENKSKKVKYLK